MFFYVAGILSLVAALLWASHDEQPSLAAATSEYRVDTTAANLSVYNTAVVDYAIANPTASGAIPTASLTLPNWFTTAAMFSNNVLADGTVRVWLTPTTTGFPENRQLLTALNQRMRGYEDLGTVSATGFTHPLVGFKTNATYVTGIPINSIAIFTKVR